MPWAWLLLDLPVNYLHSLATVSMFLQQIQIRKKKEFAHCRKYIDKNKENVKTRKLQTQTIPE